MCDCISRLHEKLQPEIHERFAKPKDPVAHFNIHTTLGGKAIVNISVYREKQMKPADSFVIAEYCPFCGAKYPD